MKTLVRSRCAMRDRPKSWQSPPKRWFLTSCGRKKIQTNNIQRNLIGSVSEARVIDVVLHLSCAQGRVLRQEARTRYAAEFDGVESEADRFNQYLVGRRHRV